MTFDPYRISTPIGFSGALRFQKSSIGLRFLDRSAPALLHAQNKLRLFVRLLYQIRTYFQNK